MKALLFKYLTCVLLCKLPLVWMWKLWQLYKLRYNIAVLHSAYVSCGSCVFNVLQLCPCSVKCLQRAYKLWQLCSKCPGVVSLLCKMFPVCACKLWQLCSKYPGVVSLLSKMSPVCVCKLWQLCFNPNNAWLLQLLNPILAEVKKKWPSLLWFLIT